jgi:hypothetical protein
MEIAGEKCYDLLNFFNPIDILKNDNNEFHPFPLVEVQVYNAEQLVDLVKYGCGVRATASTGVHDTSSRSHAMLRIYIRYPTQSTPNSSNSKAKGQASSPSVNEGMLTLVDLAG